MSVTKDTTGGSYFSLRIPGQVYMYIFSMNIISFYLSCKNLKFLFKTKMLYGKLISTLRPFFTELLEAYGYIQRLYYMYMLYL